ncbi:hypothetical protein EDD16DRAFT_1519585 [Pisolithus croceorrhizus]|nr:hypothetical protein EDD16DRAFT_1519585 [Pisolithus croceorrhizus]
MPPPVNKSAVLSASAGAVVVVAAAVPAVTASHGAVPFPHHHGYGHPFVTSYASVNVLHDPVQSFAGGLLHNPLMEGEYQQQGAGGGELVEGTQNVAYAFPPCLAGLQREEVGGTHVQEEQQDAWDKVQWEVDDGVEEVVDKGGS